MMFWRSFIEMLFFFVCVFLIFSCVVIVIYIKLLYINNHIYCIKSDFEYKDRYNFT